MTSGALWDWGLGTTGQLGIGTAVTKKSPVQVTGIANAERADGGADYSVLLRG